MSIAQRNRFTMLGRLFAGKSANCLQHFVASTVVRIGRLADEAVVDEIGKEFKKLELGPQVVI